MCDTMPRCTARASGSLWARKKYVPVPGATNGFTPSGYAFRWIDTNALTLARRAITGRSPSATGSAVVRVMTTRAPRSSRIVLSRIPIGRVACGSHKPVGPVAPTGGWPGSTAMVSPASGRAGSMRGWPRSLSTSALFSHTTRYPYGALRRLTVTRARSARDHEVHAVGARSHLHVRGHASRGRLARGHLARVEGVDEDIEVAIEPDASEATLSRDERHHGAGQEEPLVRPAGHGPPDDHPITVRGGVRHAELHEADRIATGEGGAQRIDSGNERGQGIGARGRQRLGLHGGIDHRCGGARHHRFARRGIRDRVRDAD